MPNLTAQRMKGVPKSFIREILKVTADPTIISFAGGLPHPDFFPVKGIQEAVNKVLDTVGPKALQYSTTEGHPPLRQWISDRLLKKKGLKIPPDQILITSGSQQGIALLCKTFVNKNDNILLERPAYLGAIQAMTFYEPNFFTANLHDDGIDVDEVDRILSSNDVKLYYAVPNFQNPTGISYSYEKRKQLGEVLKKHDIIFAEDDPYYDIRFEGDDLPSMRTFVDNNVLLLGSFSKSVAPGFRIAYIAAQPDLMEPLIISKQAADLHSSTFSQYVLAQFLADNDIDIHIAKIRKRYGEQKRKMIEMIEQHFPEEVKYTNPHGGMFLWAEMPEAAKAMDVLEIAIKEKVVFVPGETFYVDGTGKNTMRINFTNSPEDKIEEGIKKLSKAMKEIISKSRTEVLV